MNRETLIKYAAALFDYEVRKGEQAEKLLGPIAGLPKDTTDIVLAELKRLRDLQRQREAEYARLLELDIIKERMP